MLSHRHVQFCTAAFVACIGIILAVGAARLPVEKGYSILGPQVFPFVIAALLIILAVILAIQAIKKGSQGSRDQHSVAAQKASPKAAAWVSGGLLTLALLINSIGFVLAASILFAMAARGFGSKRILRDLLLGIGLVLPLYWLFSAGLGISLPPLVNAWI